MIVDFLTIVLVFIPAFLFWIILGGYVAMRAEERRNKDRHDDDENRY